MSRLRDEILNAQDIESERVTEWGREFELRALSGERLAHLLGSMPTNGDGKVDSAKAGAAMLIEMAHDPKTGERIFEETDRDVLTRKSARVLNRLNRIMLRLNGMDEAATKNGSGASGGSTTGSPETSEAEPSLSS